MRIRVQKIKDLDMYHWVLIAANNKEVAWSSQTWLEKSKATEAGKKIAERLNIDFI